MTNADPELRVAATFTGGGSLAVWMGGLAREMNLLLAASRERDGDVSGRHQEPSTHASREVRRSYQRLLDLLGLRFSVDILSGTSAGGINAALLGMANVRRGDLGGLRELWISEGSLDRLLRSPSEPRPPALLRGDEVLLAGIGKALDTIEGPGPGADDDPTRVMITTTLLDGELRPHPDDYGDLIHDTDHRGLFTFTAEDLRDPRAAEALALAARASASFPGAFEPAFVPIGRRGSPGHPDMASYTAASRTQFCVDGGLLANRPLGPALRAVFDRPADREVRRVLAYVAPAPGVAATLPGAAPAETDIPGLGPALLADLNALLSQTISADLEAIDAHNKRVGATRRTDGLLARLDAVTTARLAEELYGPYREWYARTLAQPVAEETLRLLTAGGRRAPDGRPVGFGGSFDALMDAATTTISEELPGTLPQTPRELACLGRPALDAGKATVLAILRAGFALWPQPDDRAELNQLVARVHRAMPERPRSLGEVIDGIMSEPDGTDVRSMTQAEPWRAAVRSVCGAQTRGALAEAWHTFGDVLSEARLLVDRAAPPTRAPAAPADQVALLRHLTGTDGRDPVDRVVRRLFHLQVLRHLTQPQSPEDPQVVELVQFSADTRTDLDGRSSAQTKLTGVQLYDFGAFYKASWRASDWMWGRLDGCGWLVHVLLDPRLLARRTHEVGGRDALLDLLEPIAGSERTSEVVDELAFLTDSTARPPRSLPVTAMWVASGMQRTIAGEELPHIARTAEADVRDGAAPRAAVRFLQEYHQVMRHADLEEVPEAQVERLLHACRISDERFLSEVGTEKFLHTAFQTAAVATRSIGACLPFPGTVRSLVVNPVIRAASLGLWLLRHAPVAGHGLTRSALQLVRVGRAGSNG
ncbi:patatin-like protein [Streptomyces phyllanthi]|nr:patatin-like protein [Streptomyces phyllanthi]